MKRPGEIDLVVGPEGIRECKIAGYADIEAERPMAMDSLLWMASTGKVVTSSAFMTLVEAGAVALDDPVSKYLPHFRNLYRATNPDDPQSSPIVPVKIPVTLRHLLSHTAGLQWLPGFFQGRELTYISLETQTHVYAASPLIYEPGTGYAYSNAGINTVGRVIEVLTGMAYEDFVQERFFDPLGMVDTGYHPTSEQVARRACGYRYDREAETWIRSDVTNQMSVIPYDGPNRHAECGGGLFSTAADMAKFAQMLAAGGTLNGRRYISEASLAEMSRRQTPPCTDVQYGLGCGVGAVGHGGAWKTRLNADFRTGVATLHLVQKTGDWPEDFIAKEAKMVGN